MRACPVDNCYCGDAQCVSACQKAREQTKPQPPRSISAAFVDRVYRDYTRLCRDGRTMTSADFKKALRELGIQVEP